MALTKDILRKAAKAPKVAELGHIARKSVSPYFIEALDNIKEGVLITGYKPVGNNSDARGMFCEEAVIYANQAFCDIIGRKHYSPLEGKFLRKVFLEHFNLPDLEKKYGDINPASRFKFHLKALGDGSDFTVERSPSFSNPKLERHIYCFRSGKEKLGLGVRGDGDRQIRLSRKLLSDLSHEIRTPLNAIIGFSEMIQSEVFGSVDNSRYRSYIQDIVSSGRDLLSTLGSMLELTRLESGLGRMGAMESDLVESLNVVLVDIRPKALEYNVDVRVESCEYPVNISVEQTVLERILQWSLSFLSRLSSQGGVINAGISITPDGRGKLLMSFTANNHRKGMEKRGSSKSFTCNDEENSFNLFLARRFLRMIGGYMEVQRGDDSAMQGLALYFPGLEQEEDKDKPGLNKLLVPTA